MLYNRSSNTDVSTVKRNLTMAPYQSLVSYVNEIVYDKARHTDEGLKLDVNDLEDHEIGKLAALFLEYDDRDTTDLFKETHRHAYDDKITLSLLKLLQD